MTIKSYTQQLTQFREQLYHSFNNRADTLMELIDAMCCNTTARSVVEYTLTPCFRRTYSTLYKAIDASKWGEEQLAQVLAPYLPPPQQRLFWLLAVDATPQPRSYAPTLPDRSMVYQPTPVRGNKPVTIGHQYSSVTLLPEDEEGVTDSWVVPLRTKRIRTTKDKELVGAGQIDALLQDDTLPLHKKLCVEVNDTGYSKPAY